MTKFYIFFTLSYLLTFLLTYFGVEKFRRWSLRRELFDVPNERSSHVEPTPRGGGLIIFAVSLSVYAAYCLIFDVQYLWAYFVGALIVGLISWLDDLYTVSVVWRFLAHGLAAFAAIWNLGFWEKIYLPFYGEIFFGQFGIVITFFWIVGLINAYNFMDGIDGIAGAQAVTAGIGWFFVGILLTVNHAGFYGGVLAISALAFTLHNWQPARIFMGDVGSAFLGFTFALLPLIAMREAHGAKYVESWLPLIAFMLVLNFAFDSLLTFTRRLLKLEKVWQPHRSHIYQRLVIGGLSHQMVTTIYAATSAVTVGILILRLNFGDKSGDWMFLVIFLQIFGLLAYNLTKKD